MGKFLFQPIFPFTISQHFGENRACVDEATMTHVITCDGTNPPPGYISLYGPGGHKGLDIPSKRWNPVYAAYDGFVVLKETIPQRGLGIGILHKEGGINYITKYWHLAALDVDIGERVAIGDMIGYADNTGWSSGDHLHFELWTATESGTQMQPLDPLDFMYPTFALTAKGAIARIREQIAILSDKIADLLRGRLET